MHRAGGKIRPSAKVRHVPPEYPWIAQQNKVEGAVILEAVIAATGRVRDVRVLRSVPLLDQAAVDAVRQCSGAVALEMLLHGPPFCRPRGPRAAPRQERGVRVTSNS